MKMICAKGGDIIVSVFYDMRGKRNLANEGLLERLNSFAEALKDSFVANCSNILTEVSPRLKGLAESPVVRTHICTYSFICTCVFMYLHRIWVIPSLRNSSCVPAGCLC